MNRLDRLTSILIQLQSKKIVKAEEIARRFEISLRTVYRDVRSLMEAGVPIGSEAGTGYFIVDGYNLPPVMFTQEEASSMLLAHKLVEKMADDSVRKAFDSALMKIRAVLNEDNKEGLDLLQSSVMVSKYSHYPSDQFPNNFLTDIQKALVNKEVVEIDYLSTQDESTRRSIEPIGIQYYSDHWHLIGWCRLRNGYRDFRADRIRSLKLTSVRFDNQNHPSLGEYLEKLMQSYAGIEKAVIRFDKSIRNRKFMYGHVSEEDLGDCYRMTFLLDTSDMLARWLLSFGTKISVEEPQGLKDLMRGMVEELHGYYVESSKLKA